MLRGLFRTKNLDEILASVGGPQFSLKRTLNAFNITLIGIGAIIGAGIFVLPGQAAANYAGPAIVYSFILAGLAIIFWAVISRSDEELPRPATRWSRATSATRGCSTPRLPRAPARSG